MKAITEGKSDEVIGAIAKLWIQEDKIPSVEAVKLYLDSQNTRYPVRLVQKVFSQLEERGYLSEPGPHTGRRYSTDSGRTFFKEIDKNYIKF